MSYINFDNVSIDFPIFNSNSRSIKQTLIRVATGGQMGSDASGHVVIRALENISFNIKNGERVGLLGHNGAGKSTLLRVLNGVYLPSSGHALTQGNVGSLIDISLGIDGEATGRENIYVRASFLGISRSLINENFDEIVDFSELGNFIDMPLRTYSSGMLLRLAFAVSTILKPEILLMDEWLSVGDEGFKCKAEKKLNEMVEGANILVIASHSVDLILNTCNRAIWLEHGKIVKDGEAKIVCDEYFSSYSK